MSAASSPAAVESRTLYDANFFRALFGQAGFVMANTLMAHYARWIEFLGGDLRQVGWVMGISAVASLLLRPAMGRLINRFGALPNWIGGCVLFATCSLANWALVDIGLIIVIVRSGVVLGAAVVFASSLTYISQTAPDERRTEGIGIMGTAGFLGMLVGPFLGDALLGPIAERTWENYAWLFGTATAANVFCIAMIAGLRRPPNEATESAAEDSRSFFRVIWLHWPGSILLVDLAFGVNLAGPFVYVASFIDREPVRIGEWSVLGMYFWCYASMGLVFRIGLRRFADGFHSTRMLYSGILCVVAAMIAFRWVSVESPRMILIPALLGGAGHGLMFHTMTSLTIRRFPKPARGIGSTLVLMMLDLGMIGGTPLLGTIADEHGFTAMFTTIAVFMAVCGGVFAIDRRVRGLK